MSSHRMWSRAALAVVLLVGCGEEEARPPAETAGVSDTAIPCRVVKRALTARLEETLTVAGGGDLRFARYVRSSLAGSDLPPVSGFQQGVYFVSADLEGRGVRGKDDVATWAVSRSMLSTGGGLGFGIGGTARAFSDLGVDADPSRYLGLDEHTPGFEESRRCVERAAAREGG